MKFNKKWYNVAGLLFIVSGMWFIYKIYSHSTNEVTTPFIITAVGWIIFLYNKYLERKNNREHGKQIHHPSDQF